MRIFPAGKGKDEKMNFDFGKIMEFTVYFLAIINPPTKILLLASMDPPYGRRELVSVSVKSTFAAFMILISLGVAGNALLTKFFRIDLYSLAIAGGLVLLLTGLKAVREGRFYEKKAFESVPDLSIVPLAAPLIAGPGTIAISISTVATNGSVFTVIVIACALVINLVFMLLSRYIGSFLDRIHVIGPLIRISGLIVMAMAVQMMLSGAGQWLQIVFRQA